MERPNHRALVVVAAAAGLTAAAFARDAAASGHVYESVQASGVFDTRFTGQPITLSPQQTLTFQTTAAAGYPMTDTVMHLIDEHDQEVASNDDYPGMGTLSFIRYTNTSTATHTYRLIVHAYAPAYTGRGDVIRDGDTAHLFATNVRFGGYAITGFPTDTRTVQTALAPQGTTDTVVYAFDQWGHYSGFDDDSGVGYASMLNTGWHEPSEVVVATYPSAPEGVTRLYANDALVAGHDADGDSLGASLEADLAICDSRSTSPACANVFNTADSDRDGLPDAYEVFGREANSLGPPQHLPAWGADPRRKDLFVQVDWALSLPDGFGAGAPNPVSAATAVDFARYFAEGPQADLQNLAGDGVRAHLDIRGIAPDPDPTLQRYGDWGGSVQTDTSSLGAIRRGLFREHLVYARGGQTPYTGSVYPRSAAGADVMAHEEGHSVGLEHWGHDRWGGVPCKPNYLSQMNYAYPRYRHFSRGEHAGVVLDPGAVNEIVPFDASFLETAGGVPGVWNYQADPVTPGSWDVDWNFNGRFDPGGAVRAPLTFANSAIDCGGSDRGVVADVRVVGQDNLSVTAASATPRILRWGASLYAFWIDSRDARIHFRTSAVTGPDANGSCPNGSDPLHVPCSSWSSTDSIVATPTAVASFSVAQFGAGLAVAYVPQGSSNVYAVTSVNGTGWTAPTFVHASSTAPELAVFAVGPAVAPSGRVLAMFYVSSSAFGMAYTASLGDTWTDASWLVRNTVDRPTIRGNISPSVVPFPDTSGSGGGNLTACGAFPDLNSHVAFYCYDRTANAWVDLTSSLGSPGIGAYSKPSLVFHVLRNASGAPVGGDATYGQFWLTTTNWTDLLPVTYTSRPVSASAPPSSATLGSAWRMMGYFINAYTSNLFATYEDPQLSATKGLEIAGSSVLFLPYADASLHVQLRDGSDFQVMERGICHGLRDDLRAYDAYAPNGDAYCGLASDTHWGY